MKRSLPDSVRRHLWHIHTGHTARIALVRMIAWLGWAATVCIYSGAAEVIYTTPATQILACALFATVGGCAGSAVMRYVDQIRMHRALHAAFIEFERNEKREAN